MSVIFVLVGASLLLAGVFVAAFVYSVTGGQYDDPYTPSVRILFDNDTQSSSPKKKD